MPTQSVLAPLLLSWASSATHPYLPALLPHSLALQQDWVGSISSLSQVDTLNLESQSKEQKDHTGSLQPLPNSHSRFQHITGQVLKGSLRGKCQRFLWQQMPWPPRATL